MSRQILCGHFRREAPAALAYDRGAIELGKVGLFNFATREDYEAALAREHEGLGTEGDETEEYDSVAEKVRERMVRALESMGLPPPGSGGGEDGVLGGGLAPHGDRPTFHGSTPGSGSRPPDAESRRPKASRFRGVTTTPAGKYVSRIGHAGRQLTCGYFSLESCAALAYDRGAVEIGKDSPLNFTSREEYEAALAGDAAGAGRAAGEKEGYDAVVAKVREKIARAMAAGGDGGSSPPSSRKSAGEPSAPSGDGSARPSGLTGVFVRPLSGRYNARIGHQGRKHGLGEYLYESVAGLSYDAAAERLAKDSVPNFRSRAEYELAVERDVDRVSGGEAMEEIDYDKVREAARARVDGHLAGDDGGADGPGDGDDGGPKFPPGLGHDVPSPSPAEEGASNASKSPAKEAHASQYAGVSLVGGGRYRSYLPHRGRNVRLGDFGAECAAALCHDRAAAGLGEDAKPNFRCVLF